jgi:hypothetical protein
VQIRRLLKGQRGVDFSPQERSVPNQNSCVLTSENLETMAAVVNETVTTEKMVDDNEEEKIEEAATDRSGIDIIGLTNIDTAEVLPLKEQWWSAAPAAPLEPLSPEQLLALVANDNDNINVAAGTAGKVDNIDPSTPPVIRASINTLLSQPYDMEAWARLVDECKASKWRRREILYASTRQFPTSGKVVIL